MIDRRRALLLVLLVVLAAGCGSRKPPPPPAVAAPLDALRLGLQSYQDSQYVAASQLFAKALANYRSVDDSRGQVIALMNLADVALVLGEHERALQQLAEAERLVQRDRLAGFGAQLQLMTCQAAAQAGDAPTATARCEAVLALEDADPRIALAARFELAKLAQAAGGDWRAQRARLEDDLDDDPRPTTRARLLRLDAGAARAAGDLDGAYAELTKALAIYQAELYRPGIAASHEELGAVARAQGRLDVARDHLDRALTVRMWMLDRVHGASALAALAEVEEARGATERAARLRELLEYLRGADRLEWRIVQEKYQGS
jgi:tetratricopeptide (TPR) repeat protein